MITCQSVSASGEGCLRHCGVTQTSLLGRQGVFAPSSAELNEEEEIAASWDWLEDEEASKKKKKKPES